MADPSPTQPAATFTADRLAIWGGGALFAIVLFFASNFINQVQTYQTNTTQSINTVRLESVARIATLEAEVIALQAQVNNLDSRIRAIEHFSTVNVNH